MSNEACHNNLNGKCITRFEDCDGCPPRNKPVNEAAPHGYTCPDCKLYHRDSRLPHDCYLAALAEIKRLREALIKTGCNDIFCEEVQRDCQRCPTRKRT